MILIIMKFLKNKQVNFVPCVLHLFNEYLFSYKADCILTVVEVEFVLW